MLPGFSVAGLNPALWQSVPWEAVAERQRAAALQELMEAQMAPAQIPVPQMQSGPLVSQQEAGLAGAVALLARLFGARDEHVRSGLGGYLGTRAQMEAADRNLDHQRQMLAYRQELDRLASAERAARDRLRSAERVSDRLDSHRREDMRHRRQVEMQEIRGGQSAERSREAASRSALLDLIRGSRSPEQIAAARASGLIDLPDDVWESLLAGPQDSGTAATPEPQSEPYYEPHPALERVLEARSVREPYAQAARANASLLPPTRRVELGSVWVFIDQNARKHESATRLDDRTALAAHDRDLRRHLQAVNDALVQEIEKDQAKIRALRARPNPANDAEAARLESLVAARQRRVLDNLAMFSDRLGSQRQGDLEPLDPFGGQTGILPTLPRLGQPSGSPSLSGPIR